MAKQKEYVPVVAAILSDRHATTVLDAPSGTGWLRPLLPPQTVMDGADLYDARPDGYRNFWAADLDHGLPADAATYDAVVCCEGIEHVGNPELFMRSAYEHLNPNGIVIITTPNTWHPAARIQYLIRGFFPGFPSLAGRIEKGTHMHIMPWTFASLHLYLTLAGFSDVTLHDVDERKPRRAFEWPFGLFAKSYCAGRLKKAKSDDERRYWTQLGSPQSVYGRRLVVSGVRR